MASDQDPPIFTLIKLRSVPINTRLPEVRVDEKYIQMIQKS